jgi:mono/diheme cytochrome c family protein
MRPLLHHTGKALLLLLAAIVAGCGGSGDEYDGFDASPTTATPNKYLKFFNGQADLGAGTYTLVVATSGAGQAGSFAVTIQRNDGSAAELINGSWTSSGGLDPDPDCASGNRCYSFDIQDASGVTFTLNTALQGVLYLVANDNAAAVIATATAAGVGVPLTLTFDESEIDADEFSNAYYDAIDPMGARSTAQKYVALHGLDSPDVHVIFRDSKDLGYGRDMYMVSYPNPSACGGQMLVFYVRNFSVKIVDGFAYGPINLEAAINEDLQHHVGTNAIEFGTGRADVGDTCSPEPMARFYTFEPDYSSPNAPHNRRVRVDLDARGAKAMPQPCISCHGGKLRPLDRFGRFVAMHANDAQAQIGDTKARMQAFEVSTFEFSEQAGYRRQDLEEGLRKLNAAIYCTYPGSAGHPACAPHGGGVAAQTDPGEWSGDFGREMLLGWYGNALETAGSKYDDSYVPPGWTPTPGSVPVGADALFRKVVGPNCFVCHGKRGTEKGTNNNAGGDGKDLDFRTWDKFISHADEIERLVFDEGRMPLGLLNFQNFWGDPEKPELLASFIQPYVTDPTGFEDRRLDSKGDIVMPGRIVARAGPDRITKPNAPITLNAQASLFAESYSWEVLSSPDGSVVTLSSPGKMKTDFSADVNGDYTVQLTASSNDGGNKTDTINVKVDSGLTNAPRDLMFYDDIRTVLMGSCSTCHDGSETGIPVWWVDDASQPMGIPASLSDPPSLGFYEQVMARVNFDNIDDSLLLKKPSGVHHFGDVQIGFDASLSVGAAGRNNYDMFVNWISEGAVCGGTATECVR